MGEPLQALVGHCRLPSLRQSYAEQLEPVLDEEWEKVYRDVGSPADEEEDPVLPETLDSPGNGTLDAGSVAR